MIITIIKRKFKDILKPEFTFKKCEFHFKSLNFFGLILTTRKNLENGKVKFWVKNKGDKK